MTLEALAAIAARNAARTQGKWNQHLVDDTTVVCNGQTICCTFPEGGLDDEVDFNTDTEQREKDAAFIAHASEDIPSLLAEVARLTAVIEHDRSKVVDVLAEANAVLKNYGWLAEGRGSYAFDDDRWKDEFKVCMDSLAKVLDPMRGIASDLSDSPIKWADIVAARSMTDALAEAEKRVYQSAKEQAEAEAERQANVYDSNAKGSGLSIDSVNQFQFAAQACRYVKSAIHAMVRKS